MTDFTTTQLQPTQEHFYIVEIDVPIITGLCELEPGIEGFGTVLSCPIQDGTSAVETKTYTFCTTNTTTNLPISPIYHCLSGITETGTELTSGRGLALRGRATINFVDFKGDPNLERASAQAIKDQGTFFGKFSARNIFENRVVRIKKYRKSPTLNLSTDAEVTTYFARELNSNGAGRYTMQCADALSRVDFDQSQFPPASNGSLIADIGVNAIALPVDGLTDWEEKPRPYVVIVGDELMTVLSVTDNLTPSATLNVKVRGQDIGTPEFSTFISKVRADEHKQGDNVFICYHADQRNIAQVFRDILISVDIDSGIIPIGDWTTEVDTWLATNTMTTIVYDVGNTNDLLSQMLSNYMLDMWYDPVLNEIKLKAVSEFQPSTGEIVEGVSADFESVKIKQMEELRYSRALISYDKPFISDKEENTSYKKASLAIRPELETAEFFGKEKLRKFMDARWLDKDSADLLTRRFLQRYGRTPLKIKWRTQEKYRNFSVGDVRTLTSFEKQSFDGSPDSSTRVQIIKMQPVFDQFGRSYNVEALSYVGEGQLDSTITNGVEINLFIIAGAPPETVDFRFIFDTGQFSSTDINIPSVRAGGFALGSKLTITYINGADHQGKGGDGRLNDEASLAQPGGICYDAEGVDTDIYLGGVDPFGTTADGFIRAPGGGGGGTPDGSYSFSGFEFPNVNGVVDLSQFDSGGIADDGEFLWLMLNNNLPTMTAYKYSRSGVYQGDSITFTGGNSPGPTFGGVDILWDGTHFWVLHTDTVTVVVDRYDTNGSYTGDSKDISNEAQDCRGIAFADGNMYVTDLTTDSVYEYSLTGAVFTYTLFNFSTAGELTFGPTSIAANDDRVFVSARVGGASPDTNIYVYTRSTGAYTNIEIDTENQLGNNYVGMVYSNGLYVISSKNSTFNPIPLLPTVFKYISGGGGGGAGINVGLGFPTLENGNGDNEGGGGDGTVTFVNASSFDSGSGGDWGDPGEDGGGANGFSGGLAGKGIVKSGATVRIFGDTPLNFINGVGDAPDP